MKITVKDCLSLKAFTPSILAAGKKYVENRIRSVLIGKCVGYKLLHLNPSKIRQSVSNEIQTPVYWYFTQY